MAGLINVPLVGIGVKTLAARRWTLWARLGWSLVALALLAIQVLPPAKDPLQREFAEIWNLFSLFIVLWFTQSLAYGLALKAFYHLRRRGMR